MESISFIKADGTTQVANLLKNMPFKLLVPKEYGGGFIKDIYDGSGQIGKDDAGFPKYDIFEILAFWNHEMNEDIDFGLKWRGDFPNVKEVDDFTFENRQYGIDIGLYNKDIRKLKYPLKFVAASYKGTYEDCDGRSYLDPTGGKTPLTWEKAAELIKIENNEIGELF